ncbi:MAG: DUF262 domain-containing protein [Clostridium sp.]
MDNREIIKRLNEEDDKITNEQDYTYIINTSIEQNKTDLAFKTLIQGFDESLYVIPKYQRKYIWTQEQVENLAISLIRGLPIPPIYVYRNENKEMVILDGQQRMLSLLLYYKGKYIKNKKDVQIELQKLMDDEELINGDKTFSEVLEEKYNLKDVNYMLRYIEDNEEKEIQINYSMLPKNIRRTVDFTNISVIEIKVNSESGEESRVLYKVFENLNSAGTPLKNQELRNGVYQCKFYDMLHDINNNNKKWREIYGPIHANSKDVEMLLRFCAVQHNFTLSNGHIDINNYNNSYPKLLNDFSDEAIKFDEKEILNYKENLEKFIERVCITEKQPRLLLESLYLASYYIDGEYNIDEDICNELLEDENYTKNTLSSSSGKKKVEARFNYVYEKLWKYVKRDKGKLDREVIENFQ